MRCWQSKSSGLNLNLIPKDRSGFKRKKEKAGRFQIFSFLSFFLFFPFFADNSAFDFSLKKKNLLTLLKSDRTIFNLNRSMLTPLIKTDS